MTVRFDLLVLGGGSGGLAHAQKAAEYGVKAAVVENGPLGGTCVNVGCVPKKVMWYSAQHAHHIEHARDYGFDVVANGHDWLKLKHARDSYISRLNNIYAGNLERRGVDSDLGGSMRLGAYPAVLAPGSKVHQIYDSLEIRERHRHRYEVNNEYRDPLSEAGMSVSATSPDGNLVEMVELPDHPWFLATQFHPELKSRPTHPHPLFASFIEAAVARRDETGTEEAR